MAKKNLALLFSLLGLLAACEDGAPLDTTPVLSSAAASSVLSTPTASQPVTIFADATPQEYASLGSSTTSAGDGYTPVKQDARLINISLETIDQPRLRYNASGHYEVQLPGTTYDRLAFYAGLRDPAPDHNFFQPSRAAQNHATFIVTRSRLEGYRYSELATWTNGDTTPAQSGVLAFGAPTLPAAIPASGATTYRGLASGIVDITYFDGLFGGYYFESVDGTLTLTVDFAKRTLTGTLALNGTDQDYAREIAIPITASRVGVNGFSGLFDADQTGFNQFNVMFTGPDAQELIGGWTVPIMIEGQPHQVLGAWIAHRE